MNGQPSSAFGSEGFVGNADPAFYQYENLQQQQPEQQQAYIQGANGHISPDASAFNAQQQRFADLEKLSSEYSPEFTGPLIGDLKSTREIALEYADADPIYVAKTAALCPKGYTHYRKIRGDGNCAWRAIAFGYFELVLQSGNVEFVNREWARMTSLENLLKAAGYNRYIYEDFANETLNVYRLIQNATLNNDPDGLAGLVNAFNEDSDSIVAYLKMLTSAWMKTRPDDYQAYLETSVIDYCSIVIEPFSVELDHVGIKALVDCLLLPAEFRAEISYLDRSAGTEVNVHVFDNADNAYAPTLHLLYRPGHYDILYKTEAHVSSPLLEKASASPVQVAFMPHIPDQFFSSTPLNSFLTPTSVPNSSTMPITDRRSEERDRFRASLFQYTQYQPPSLPFQTSIFRNSAYNPSHYQSENFQPELYQPESPGTSRVEGGGSRRRL